MFKSSLQISLLCFIFSLLFAVGLVAQSNDAKNMTLFDHSEVDSIKPHSSLWGYTAPDGREYAIFGSQRGTFIYDVTEKPIKLCSFIIGPKSTWREMKVYKNFLYVGTESRDSGTGLQIIDLTDLPLKTRHIRTDTTYFLSSHTLFIQGHLLYVLGTRAETAVNGGALILDLEPDPTHPKKIGEVKPHYYHDAYERGDTLYGCAIYGQGIDIYNVKDKMNPVLMANIKYPYNGPHNAEPSQDGKYLFSADEIGYTPKTLKIWDIQDMTDIKKVAEYTPLIDDVVHNVHVYGRYALVAWYTAGVRLLDMIDPQHPREVAYFDTYPGTSKSDYNGVWESYWFQKTNKIIASDRQTGLWVFNLDLKKGASVSGVVKNSKDGTPIADAEFQTLVNNKKIKIKSDAQGKYYIGGVDGDSLSFQVNKFGYLKSSLESLVLTNDATKDITLEPAGMHDLVIKAIDENDKPIQNFQYSIDPLFGSTEAIDGEGKIKLQHNEIYWVNVGKWGYKQAYQGIYVASDNQVLTVKLEPAYRDNFTLDLGWSKSDTTDKATTGQWSRIKPFLPFAQAQWVYPPTESSGNDGGYIYQTGIPPRNTPPAEVDVNKGTVTLTSPLMNLIEYEDPKLDLELWFVHYKKDTVRDSLRIQISNNGGNTWQTAKSFATNDTNMGRGGWMHIELKLKDYIAVNNRMKIRFTTSDVKGDATMVVGIDNFYMQTNRSTGIKDEKDNSLNTNKLSLNAAYSQIDNKIRVVINADKDMEKAITELYDMLGNRIAILHSGKLSAGVKVIEIQNELPNGNYFVSTTTQNKIKSVSLNIVR